MLDFPGAQQFVNIFRGNLLQIFFKQFKLFQPDVKQLLVSHITDCHTTSIFVHQLLQPIKCLTRVNVIRVNRARSYFVAINTVGFKRLVDFSLATIYLILGYIDALSLAVVDVLTGSLGSNAPFGKRT